MEPAQTALGKGGLVGHVSDAARTVLVLDAHARRNETRQGMHGTGLERTCRWKGAQQRRRTYAPVVLVPAVGAVAGRAEGGEGERRAQPPVHGPGWQRRGARFIARGRQS